MANPAKPRRKRRRLSTTGREKARNEYEQDQSVQSSTSAHNQGHVYSSPIHVDGHAHAVFGNVSNISSHFHIVSPRDYQKAFLDSIYFEGISTRRHLSYNDTSIKPESIDWVWTTNLADWLQNSDSLFWIKASGGSGKSVLVDRVSAQHKTLSTLQRNHEKWAILYYSWDYYGSADRMLRSFLYQLARLVPEVRQLVHSAYFVDHFCGGDLQDCTNALSDMIRYTSVRICAFIDGLDGSKKSLCDALGAIQSLRDRTNIKICVASRVEKVSEENFYNSACLELEDLTRESIEMFIEEQIRTTPLIDEAYPRKLLIQHISRMSGGLFLAASSNIHQLFHDLRSVSPSHRSNWLSFEEIPDEIRGKSSNFADWVYGPRQSEEENTPERTLSDRGSIASSVRPAAHALAEVKTQNIGQMYARTGSTAFTYLEALISRWSHHFASD